MTYDYAIINIKKQILKKKFLLEELCNSMKEKNKWITVCLYLLSLLTGALSGIDYAFPESKVQLVTSILAIGTMVLLKLKSYLNYDYIKELCKKQLVKYDMLFQKIERGITKHSYDQTDEEEFILCLYRELNVLENNDPEISNSIYDRFGEMCKQMNIPFNDTISQLAELYGKSHKSNKSYGSDLQKLTLLSAQPEPDPQPQKLEVVVHSQDPKPRKKSIELTESKEHRPENESHADPSHLEPSGVDDYAQSDMSTRAKRVTDVFGDLDYGHKATVPITSPISKNKNWTLSRLKNLQD